MIEVQVRGGNLEKAMRVLKKKVQKEGIVKELKLRQFYRKPSEIKREAKKQGIKNYKKKQAKATTLKDITESTTGPKAKGFEK